jgi:hypothetical protein
MPLAHAAMHLVNATVGAPGEGFDNASVLEQIGGAVDLLEATQNSGLLDVLEPDAAAAYQKLLDDMPPSVSKAMLAAMKDALERNLRVQLVWQEARAYEVRIWESSAPHADSGQPMHGSVTLYLRSPDPERKLRKKKNAPTT